MIKRGLLLAVMILLLTSCTAQGEKAVLQNQSPVKDMNAINKPEDKGKITELYVTVLSQTNPENSGFTFKELNDGKDIKLPVILREGNNGRTEESLSGYEATGGNGTIKLRGQSARLAEEKSFKITLNEETWQGYKVINLNKHPFDSLKIRNKLSFDLFKEIPNVTCPGTNFIHLFIKDMTQAKDLQFQDFGLFTQVENIDRYFLESHGLDSGGSLYKVENFEFKRYPEVLKSKKELDYNKEKFEEILEIKGVGDHKKLLAMLNDVNNSFIHVNKVIDKNFDRQNYLTWLAINILTHNIDTTSRNFFLYNPQENSKWYFLPWDFDGGWGADFKRARWQDGISNYWGVTLHRRFLKNDKNRMELSKKIEEISGHFSEERIKLLLDTYDPIIQNFVLNQKGLKQQELESVQNEFRLLPQSVELNKERYYKSLERPMPVFMGAPIKYGDYFVFTWENSYDFQGDLIEYGIDISRTPDFNDIIFSTEGLRENQCIVRDLPAGKYYWKLTIKDFQGNSQEAFDKYVNRATGLYYFGIKEFIIE